MGRALGVSRAAIHKHMQALAGQGVPIHRVPGRGYRLADGVSLLDAAEIRTHLSERARVLASEIEILEEVDSTSAYLARSPDAASLQGRVCLAEKQTSGRGRRGRSWVACPYRDLVMSIGVEYDHWPAHLPTLGLVTAMAIINGLSDLGVEGLAVKWPNDVVHGERKFCGVLLDVAGEAHGDCRVIIGIGLNVSSDARSIDQQWVDLASIAGRAPDRNVLAAHCLNALLPVLETFPADGFAGYLPEWRRLDCLRDRPVTVHGTDGTTLHGTAAGVDASGRLRVADGNGGIHVFTQGDVSVRAR